jgi:transposase InsO family protein
VATIRQTASKTELPVNLLLQWLSLPENKFCQWVGRRSLPNRHNGKIPRRHWITDDEKQRILDFQAEHSEEGYRVLTYMMMDEGIVAVSPATVYCVLRQADRLNRWDRKPSKKGDGFDQPTSPHQQWHIDISYVNILGTFYYLIAVLDGYSRYIIHWELRESMTSDDVQTTLQRAVEKAGRSAENLISDNGRQFVARDFRHFLRVKGMKHVTTSPYYPQSNGKLERAHKTIKSEAIRKKVILSYEDAVDNLTTFIDHYNHHRLHAALQYVTPKHMLEDTAQQVWDRRDQLLEEARRKRWTNSQS